MGLRGFLPFNIVLDAAIDAFLLGISQASASKERMRQDFGRVNSVQPVSRPRCRGLLTVDNGLYYPVGKPFSSFIQKKYGDNSVSNIGSSSQVSLKWT